MKELLLRKNTPEVRERLRATGVHVCCCTEFTGWDWLTYGDYGVHGVGDDDEIPRELFLAEFTADCGVDCGVDVERFINEIKKQQQEWKNK